MKVTRTKSRPIQAGTLDNVIRFLKDISNKLFDLFDRLGEDGMQIVEQKSTDSSQFFKLKHNDTTAGVTITSIDDNKCNVAIQPDGGSVVNLNSIDKSAVASKVEDVLTKVFNTSSKQSIDSDTTAVSSAKKLQVTLNTITSATGVDINMTAINANYDLAVAMQDLNDILNDTEFVSHLSQEPTSFEITDSGESFDIEQTDSFDTADTINQLITAAVQLWSNLKVLHWAAKGVQMQDMHYRFDDHIWRAAHDLDLFGEYAVECGNLAPNPMSNCCNISLIQDGGGFTAEQGYAIAKDEIKKYIDVLETLYVNFPHDFQSELDDMIRRWKKDADYFLTRVTM